MIYIVGIVVAILVVFFLYRAQDPVPAPAPPLSPLERDVQHLSQLHDTDVHIFYVTMYARGFSDEKISDLLHEVNFDAKLREMLIATGKYNNQTSG